MVELIKRNIHMNRWKGSASTQVTLDDDFIVPDTMDDLARIVISSGDIQVESVKNQGEKVLVKGRLVFQVLYRREEGGLQTMAGSMPFEEPVNMPGLEEKDYLSVSWELEDFRTEMINSRKLSVKAVITLQVRAESLYDAEAAEDAAVTGEEGGAAVEIRRQESEAAAIAVRRKDTCRIRETICLPASKPEVERVLWSELRLRDASARPMDGQVHTEGKLELFMLYESGEDGAPAQWLEESIPFSGDVELAESTQDRIPSISLRLVHKEAEAKPDADGEMRELEVDAVLELDIRLYEEQPLQLLTDLYALDRELETDMGQVCFDRLLAVNTGECRIAEKIQLEKQNRVLQICHADGMIKIDETEPQKDSLLISGVLEASFLYLTSDDEEPVRSVSEAIPFQYTADAPGIGPDSVYQLNTGVKQLSAVMAGADTVELRAVLSLDILVLQPVCEPVIRGVRELPPDMEKLQRMPGITGYVVQPEDTLWDIAKKFHTTREQVMAFNGMEQEEVRAGDRLILIKQLPAS